MIAKLLPAAVLASCCLSAQAANLIVDITASVQVLPDGACNQQCTTTLADLATDSGLSTAGFNPLLLTLEIDVDAIPYDGSQQFSGFYSYAVRRMEGSFGNLGFVATPGPTAVAGNFGRGNTLRLQAPPYISRFAVDLDVGNAGPSETMNTSPVASLAGPARGYLWRSADVEFLSAAFVSQDLNDLEAMLGAANLFGNNLMNYFDFGVDVINPLVVIGTYPAGQPFYSTYYPTFSLRGTVTDIDVRPAVVPLPAGVWLLGSAVALLAGRMRRSA